MLQNNLRMAVTGSQKGRTGFTLIELLVVIAIIAILASILFPVFGRARENGRRSSCQSNLKQIGIGMLQYSQDYDEKMIFWYNNNVSPQENWMDIAQPYVKSTQIFVCPSISDKKYTPKSTTEVGGYAINVYGDRETNASNPQGPVSLADGGTIVVRSMSAIQTPATTVWVADSLGGDSSMSEVACFYWDNGSAGISGTPRRAGDYCDGNRIVEQHLNTTNVLWVDGHVKAVKLDSLAVRTTAAGVTPANTMKLLSIQDD